MNETEAPIAGWEAIQRTLACCRATAFARRNELMAAGAIFYMRRGRPPRKRVYHFPSILKKWTGVKSSIGEIV